MFRWKQNSVHPPNIDGRTLRLETALMEMPRASYWICLTDNEKDKTKANLFLEASFVWYAKFGSVRLRVSWREVRKALAAQAEKSVLSSYCRKRRSPKVEEKFPKESLVKSSVKISLVKSLSISKRPGDVPSLRSISRDLLMIKLICNLNIFRKRSEFLIQWSEWFRSCWRSTHGVRNLTAEVPSKNWKTQNHN